MFFQPCLEFLERNLSKIGQQLVYRPAFNERPDLPRRREFTAGSCVFAIEQIAQDAVSCAGAKRKPGNITVLVFTLPHFLGAQDHLSRAFETDIEGISNLAIGLALISQLFSNFVAFFHVLPSPVIAASQDRQ